MEITQGNEPNTVQQGYYINKAGAPNTSNLS
jgi:hypothetical protein